MSVAYNAGRARHLVDDVSTIDCQKQVRSWRFLRSLVEFLVPSCNCYYLVEREGEGAHYNNHYYYYNPRRCIVKSTTTVTGTIFGYRQGRVSFCVQANKTNTTLPILLLELAVPTAVLAKEMKSGHLRIELECHSESGAPSPLLSEPIWSMSCNGRKVGFAVKRQPSQADVNVLKIMQSVSVGTGIIGGNSCNPDHELMYLRANFERVARSADFESYHLINPDGSNGQELSIFFHCVR